MLTYIEQLKDKKTETGYPLLFIILVVCAVANVFLVGIYILTFVSIFYFLLRNKIIIQNKTVVLFLFAIFYTTFFLVSNGFSLEPFKTFTFLLLWLVVYNLSKDKSIKQIFIFILLLGYGMAIHGILNFVYNTINGTEMIEGRSYDFWSKTYSSATGQAINFTLFISISFWAIFLQKNSVLKFLSVMVFIVSLVYDVQLGGRTFLILCGGSVVLGLLIYIIVNSIDGAEIKKIIFLVISVLVLFLLFIVAFKQNWFGIKTLYENSYLAKRLNNTNSTSFRNDGRIEKKLYYLQHFFDNPWGGKFMEEVVGSSHELWLDVYDTAGILPYVLIIIFTFQSIKTVWRIVRERKIESSYRVGLAVYIFVILAQFFVEPILTGSPLLFCSYLMIDAALTRFCDDNDMV